MARRFWTTMPIFHAGAVKPEYHKGHGKSP